MTGNLQSNVIVKEKKDVMEKLDRFDRDALERLVHQAFRDVAADVEAPYLTLAGLHKKLVSDPSLPQMSVETLRKVLHCLGYRHVLSEVNRNIVLLERDEIVEWRKRYAT